MTPAEKAAILLKQRTVGYIHPPRHLGLHIILHVSSSQRTFAI